MGRNAVALCDAEGTCRHMADLDAERIQIEAIGQPGERRFRLLALVNGQTTPSGWRSSKSMRSASPWSKCWSAYQRLARTLGAPSIGDFDRDTRKQFRVGRVELGYDDSDNRLVIVAHDLNQDDEGEAAFACRLTLDQARGTQRRSCGGGAAGRPRCTCAGSRWGQGPRLPAAEWTFQASYRLRSKIRTTRKKHRHAASGRHLTIVPLVI